MPEAFPWGGTGLPAGLLDRVITDNPDQKPAVAAPQAR
jgi:hypothetical protein